MEECEVCQKNKDETVASPGLLQLLPILTQVWTAISMDLVDGLPTLHGKGAIFVVVECLIDAGCMYM